MAEEIGSKIQEDKKRLRLAMKEKLIIFSRDKKEHSLASRRASFNLFNTAIYKDASIIFIYLSLPYEVETSLIIATAMKDKKSVCIPRVVSGEKGGRLEFFYLSPSIPIECQTEIGLYGIKEPLTTLKSAGIRANIHKKTLILTPGLAFTKEHIRLGQGGGYYDKYIESVESAKKIEGITGQVYFYALAFNFQIVRSIPRDKFDKKIDGIITEDKVF